MSKPTYQPPAREHPFASYIRSPGKGKSASRSLSQREAREAFGMIPHGATEPLQQGDMSRLS